MTAAEMVRLWIAEADKGIAEAVAKSPEAPSCTACTNPACCKQKLYAHFAEVIPIVKRLQEEGRDTPELRAELRSRDEGMRNSTHDEWFDANRPCMFLVDKRCSIYAERPISCRAYFVISPAEKCDGAAGEDPEVKILSLLHHYQAHASEFGIQLTAEMGLKPSKKRVYFGTFPGVLLRALEACDHSDFRGWLRAQSWPSEGLEELLESRK